MDSKTIQCPKCATKNFYKAKSCVYCNLEFITPKSPKTTQNGGSAMKVIAILLWLGTIGGVFLGTFILVTGLVSATGAPQEAVVCCLALACAILPYCFARAVTEIISLSKD